MIKSKVVLFLVLSVGYSGSLLAAPPEWSDALVIDQLRTVGGGKIMAKIVSGTHSCVDDTLVLEYENGGHDRERETFAILLSAMVTGYTVKIYTDRCDSSDRNVVTGVRILQPQ